VIYLGSTLPGSVHDLTLIVAEFIAHLLANVRIWADLGYLGLDKLVENARVKLPIKKSKYHKLADGEKAYNRRLSSVRVLVENCISGIKRYNIVKQRYRGRSIDDFDGNLATASALWNLKLSA